MLSWKSVYRRNRENRQFTAYFARQGRVPKEADFDLRVFCLPFENLAGSATAGIPGPLQGPLTQTFDRGAVIIGITSGCFALQQARGSANYGPSWNAGKRDLFVLYFERTGDEPITPSSQQLTATTFNQLTPGGQALQYGLPARVKADASTGSSIENLFPQEILIPPSQGVSVAAAALVAAATIAQITVNVAFHAMVPRA